MPLIRRAGTGARHPPAVKRALPGWFEANRVQGHTRLGIRGWLDEPEFAQAAGAFKAFGARAFSRHVKSRDEDPWWPTALPLAPDGRPLSDRDRTINGQFIPRGRNVVQEMVDEARSQGMRMMAYHWHMTEETFEGLNPEWVCKNQDGSHAEGPGGIHLDITGPYREVVLTRLLELAEIGVDAFYFDYRHLPPKGAWGSALEEAWKAETGDAAAPEPDDSNPRYRRFVDFKAEKIEETFAYWRDQVKATHPTLVFAVSTTTVPALTDPEMTTRLAEVADSAKNEYTLALSPSLSKKVFLDFPALAPEDHVRQAVGWTVLRDASDGRAPHIWAGGLPDRHHARAFAASLMTFGCVAAMDVDEGCLLGARSPEPWKTPVDGLEAAFALGAAASPHLAGTHPLRWAAIHFGERNRNKRGDDYRAAWEEVLWPLVGAFQVLSEDGLPVGIVNDRQLERGELGGYRLLVLPNPDELSPGQEQAVGAFRARGGAVLENDPAWGWSDPQTRSAAAAAFRAVLRPGLRTAPVRVTGGPANLYAVSFAAERRLVVAVTNDFNWVQITSRDDVPDPINPPAPQVRGVQVSWGAGRDEPQIPSPWPGLQRFRAVEAISGETLEVERVGAGHGVGLPPFDFMALLVVTVAYGRPRLPGARG